MLKTINNLHFQWGVLNECAENSRVIDTIAWKLKNTKMFNTINRRVCNFVSRYVLFLLNSIIIHNKFV